MPAQGTDGLCELPASRSPRRSPGHSSLKPLPAAPALPTPIPAQAPPFPDGRLPRPQLRGHLSAPQDPCFPLLPTKLWTQGQQSPRAVSSRWLEDGPHLSAPPQSREAAGTMISSPLLPGSSHQLASAQGGTSWGGLGEQNPEGAQEWMGVGAALSSPAWGRKMVAQRAAETWAHSRLAVGPAGSGHLRPPG